MTCKGADCVFFSN